MEDKHKIEGELLVMLKAHLIHKLKEKSRHCHNFDFHDAEDVINAFDGVPTPPPTPPGSGTS